MKFINEDFVYYVSGNLYKESIVGLKQYFPEIAIPDTPDYNGKFVGSRVIGTLMFELIQNRNLEFDAKALYVIEYINYYLEQCLNNDEYCDNKIFLPCIKHALNTHLPNYNFYFENDYTAEQAYSMYFADYKEATSIIFNNRNDIIYSKVYYCHKIEDLILASLYEVFDAKYIIRKCKNCNKFFVTKEKGKRIKYCYNGSPQNPNKSCYQYCSQLTYIQKRKNNPIRKEYTKLYNKYNNRYIRARDAYIEKYSLEEENLQKQNLEKLKLFYNNLKEDLKLNRISKEDALLALKNYEKGDNNNGN